MKKLPVVIATCVLGLWGCASSKPARYDTSNQGSFMNDVDLARRARLDAPTVYNGEPTGGPGYTVTTDDGRLWAPEVAPGNTVIRTASDVPRSLERQDAQSEVIDEGPTPTDDRAPRQ
jgi:hypothetical protein